MNVFIARDGMEIGECSREEIAEHVRSGEILPTDHYWHEGMEAWGVVGEQIALPLESAGETTDPEPLPEPPQTPPVPRNWRVITATAVGATLAVAILAAWLIRPDASDNRAAKGSLSGAAPTPQLSDAELRDKAAADLKYRIDRLPAVATEPVNAAYFDVSVHMQKMLSRRTPWSAVIKGRINAISPGTAASLSQTEFSLHVDYTDGAWTYKSYEGAITNLGDSTPTKIEHNSQVPAPPSIVGELGLEIPARPDTSISLTR